MNSTVCGSFADDARERLGRAVCAPPGSRRSAGGGVGPTVISRRVADPVQVHFTSSAVIGVPSENLAFGLSVKVQTVASGELSQLSATPGTMLPSARPGSGPGRPSSGVARDRRRRSAGPSGRGMASPSAAPADRPGRVFPLRAGRMAPGGGILGERAARHHGERRRDDWCGESKPDGLANEGPTVNSPPQELIDEIILLFWHVDPLDQMRYGKTPGLGGSQTNPVTIAGFYSFVAGWRVRSPQPIAKPKFVAALSNERMSASWAASPSPAMTAFTSISCCSISSRACSAL